VVYQAIYLIAVAIWRSIKIANYARGSASKICVAKNDDAISGLTLSFQAQACSGGGCPSRFMSSQFIRRGSNLRSRKRLLLWFEGMHNATLRPGNRASSEKIDGRFCIS
jgi:hypothetical protein